MKIVKIQGGLGNQMFQYAFAKSLENAGHEVFFDISLYEQKIIRNGINYVHNGFELSNLFKIDYKQASIHDVKKLATLPNNLLNRVRRKYFTKKTHYIDRIFKYTPEIFTDTQDKYLEGYWQTEKYFDSIRDTIRRDFTFTQTLSEQTQKLVHILKNGDNFASIHVRRGDYLNGKMHAVCDARYYNNAIAYALAQSPIEKFFVFSNDIAWCKEYLHFNGVSADYIDWNTGDDSWQDMYCMSLCPGNIIANSSFSWWAAWLNNAENKKIIAPAMWSRREIDYKDNYYTYDYSDIVPKTWNRIPIH